MVDYEAASYQLIRHGYDTHQKVIQVNVEAFLWCGTDCKREREYHVQCSTKRQHAALHLLKAELHGATSIRHWAVLVTFLRFRKPPRSCTQGICHSYQVQPSAHSFPIPRPAFRRLQYDEKLGLGLGTRLTQVHPMSTVM